MPETTPPILNHFGLFKFSDNYFRLSTAEKKAFRKRLVLGLMHAAENVDIYQVYPTEMEADILIWSALKKNEDATASSFFTQYAQATNPYRKFLTPSRALWGFTKPSQYTKTRSTQEIDPFKKKRKPYLVIYPFTKNEDWYLMSRESRQGMMNEHIKIGKQYPQITQLLLYSFGLQDHEFVVVYESEDLTQFSDLVHVLRDTEARRYTKSDKPLHTAIYHPAEKTLALWDEDGDPSK